MRACQHVAHTNLMHQSPARLISSPPPPLALQVCTGVMLHGYPLIKTLCGGLQVGWPQPQLMHRPAAAAGAHPAAQTPRLPACNRGQLLIFRIPRWRDTRLVLLLLLVCLQAFMQQHDFQSIADFKGASLPYFTTHHELVRMQREALDAKRKAWVGLAKDDEWSGDGFVAEAESMVSNS